MPNDNQGNAGEAVGIALMGVLALFALGSLAAPTRGPFRPTKPAEEPPPTDPERLTGWYLAKLQNNVRWWECESRTRELLSQLR